MNRSCRNFAARCRALREIRRESEIARRNGAPGFLLRRVNFLKRETRGSRALQTARREDGLEDERTRGRKGDFRVEIRVDRPEYL